MKKTFTILKVFLVLLVAVSLVTCSQSPSCVLEGSDGISHMHGRVPMDRPEAASSGCGTGGSGSTCSSTLTPTEVLFDQGTTGAINTLAISTGGNLALMCTTATPPLGQQLVVANLGGGTEYLYVLQVTAGTATGTGTATITGFTIGQVAPITLTQAGTALSLSGTGLFQGLFEIQADPSGRFLTLTDFTLGEIHVLLIDSTTGALSVAPGSPFASANALFMAVSSDGTTMYVSDSVDDQIFIYTIDTASLTAVLTLSTTFVEPTHLAVNAPSFLLVSPGGNFLYTANAQSISFYSIDPTTDLLGGPIAGSPVTPAPTFNPFLMAFDNTDSFLYVTGTGSEGVLGYTFNSATGALTAIGGSPFASGLAGTISDIVPDLTLPVVYLLIDGTIQPYTVGTTTGGALTAPSTAGTFTASGNIVIAGV